MHCAASPRSAEIRQNASFVQPDCDLSFRLAIFRETIVDFLDNCDLIIGAWHQDHTVCLNALVFASYEKSF